MSNTILQVPIDKNIRDQAASKAKYMGFSSLQEIIRLFVNRVAKGEINFTFEETVQLSPKAIKRYNKMINEIEAGKNISKSFDTTEELMKHLNEN